MKSRLTAPLSDDRMRPNCAAEGPCVSYCPGCQWSLKYTKWAAGISSVTVRASDRHPLRRHASRSVRPSGHIRSATCAGTSAANVFLHPALLGVRLARLVLQLARGVARDQPDLVLLEPGGPEVAQGGVGRGPG